MAYAITNQNQIINASLIKENCDQLKDIVKDLENIKTEIANMANEYPKEILYFSDIVSAKDVLLTNSEELEELIAKVNNYIDSITSTTNELKTVEQQKLNDYLASLKSNDD